MLLSRGPSFPALVLDTSADHVEENLFRRGLHSRIMDNSPGAFRRKKTKDGPIASMEEIAKMRDLLGTMHPYKDPNDIDKSHKYSSSRRLELDKLAKTNLEEYQFANMKPIDDFLQPMDSTSPRRTGYEHGHIRNVMKLDSFGPSNSRQNTRERERSGGLLPPPNVDRFATLEAVASRSKFSRSGSPCSANSSRPSTAQSTASIGTVSDQSSSLHFRTTQSSPELRIAPSLRSLYLNRPTTPVELTMPASLRKDTFQGGEKRITEEERKVFDPNVKRKTYSQIITQRAKVRILTFPKLLFSFVGLTIDSRRRLPIGRGSTTKSANTSKRSENSRPWKDEKLGNSRNTCRSRSLNRSGKSLLLC